MIGFFGHASEVGWYNASSRIAVSIMTVSGTLISGSFYPLLSRSFSESKAKLQKGWNYYMEIMIILAIPLMFGGIILANQIIGFFYGLENYGPSVFVFQALLIVTGISFLYYPYAMILIVAGNQKKNFLIIFLGATLNIILNLVLVPKFGFYAAAVSTVAVTALALILVIPLSKRYASISIFNLRLFKVLIAAIFSSLLMAMIIKRFAFYNLGIIAITASGAFIYFISLLFLYRVFLKSDFFTRVYTSGKPR
jgi:O-antigen/teichoic acid export membrane protein